MIEVIDSSAMTLAKAIRAKQVSSVEVVDAYLRRIEAVNSQLRPPRDKPLGNVLSLCIASRL